MTIREDKKDAGLWVAKLVATTIVCVLMYKGMAILGYDEDKARDHEMYKSLHVVK